MWLAFSAVFAVVMAVVYWLLFYSSSTTPRPSVLSMVFFYFLFNYFSTLSCSLNIKRCILTLITYLLLLMMTETFSVITLNFISQHSSGKLRDVDEHQPKERKKCKKSHKHSPETLIYVLDLIKCHYHRLAIINIWAVTIVSIGFMKNEAEGSILTGFSDWKNHMILR